MLQHELENWCARMGKTRQDAARELNAHTTTLWAWVSLRRRPKPGSMKALADLLGVDPLEILDEFRRVGR